MTDKQEKIDVYECPFYQQDRLSWCKYYPKGCNKCRYLIKVGEEILNDNKQIIIDGLACDNCPEAKRCQEQQAKKEYAINQVLQDIPSEYANIIDRLKQIIPSVTRCDYVLEKQLKAKEQECEELKDKIKFMEGYIETVESARNEFEQKLYKIKSISEEHNCDLDNGYVFLNIIKIIEE